MSIYPIKLVLLLFWSAWFSLVLLTNLLEGLQIVGVLPKNWKLASNNYELIGKATSVYHLSAQFNQAFFASVILWQVVAVALFWRSFFLTWTSGSLASSALIPPFATGLGLFAAFMLSDEIFHYYQGERSHLEIFTGLLVTLIALALLP